MNEHTLPASVEFDGKSLTIIDHNGKPWLTVSQIVRALGMQSDSGIQGIYRRNRDEFTDDMTTVIRQGSTRVRIFSPRGAHLIGMLARTEKAKAFRRFALDVLEGLGRGQPEKSLPAPAGPPQPSPAVRSAIDRGAHAVSLRAYESVREQLAAEVDGWLAEGRTEEWLVDRIKGLTHPQGVQQIVSADTLWALINRIAIAIAIAIAKIFYDAVLDEIHDLEKTTGRQWYSRPAENA